MGGWGLRPLGWFGVAIVLAEGKARQGIEQGWGIVSWRWWLVVVVVVDFLVSHSCSA